MADVRENFEISKEDPKFMICTICGSRLSKDSNFQKHLETKKHLKELNSLEIKRKEEKAEIVQTILEQILLEIVTENKSLEKVEEVEGENNSKLKNIFSFIFQNFL